MTDVESDPPGWYCFRPVPALAEWDGTAWTGSTHYAAAAPVLAGPPKPFAFLRQSWVWWIVAGQILVIPPAVASGVTGNAVWSWFSAPGYIAFLIGTVQVMARYLPIGRLPHLGRLTAIGVGGGLVGFGLAFVLESVIDHRYGITATLWSTGPIEESAKLLVPFALLVFGSSRFADPLTGLYLVLVSGGTTGAVEGIEWESRTRYVWLHLQLALVRPAAEIPHVFVTGFAGAVIWLAAWRRGRAVTLAGTVAFLLAVGLHSLHDGFITLFGVSPQPSRASIPTSAGHAVALGIGGLISALGIGIAAFMLGRHGARELSPPSSVASAPPPWRPQIKTWGAVDPVRILAPLPVGYQAYPGHGVQSGYGVESGNGVQSGYAVPVPPAVVHPSLPPPPLIPTLVTAPASAPPPTDAPAALPTFAPRSAMAAPPAPPSAPPPAVVPTLAGPATAPPGWYPVGGDASRAAWWNGTAWSAPMRWDGSAWRRE